MIAPLFDGFLHHLLQISQIFHQSKIKNNPQRTHFLIFWTPPFIVHVETKLAKSFRYRVFQILFTSKALNRHAEVIETCGKFSKCVLNIYLAIRKRYNIIIFLKKKLRRFQKAKVRQKPFPAQNCTGKYALKTVGKYVESKNMQNFEIFKFKKHPC